MKTLRANEDGTHTFFDEAGKELPSPLPSPLEFAKREKLRDVGYYGTHAENNGFVWAGHTFASDPPAQVRIALNAVLAMRKASDFPLDWELADGTVISLSAQDMMDVAVALAEHLDAVQVIARDLHAKLAAATTAQEVQAVVWP